MFTLSSLRKDFGFEKHIRTGEAGLAIAHSSGPPLDDLEAWYLSDTGITKDASDYVSVWADQSGNGRDLEQGTGSAQPLWVDSSLNNLPVVTFNGTGQIMTSAAFTLNQPLSMYLVLKQISWTDYDNITCGNTSSPYGASLIQRDSTPEVSLYAQVSGWDAYNDELTVGNYGILAAIFDGSSSRLRVDDGTAQTGNPGSYGISYAMLGGWQGQSYYANIAVAEWLIYGAAHNVATEAQVRGYLEGRYAL